MALSNHIKGDTFNGFELKIEDSLNVPKNLTGFSVLSQFKTSPTGNSELTFSTQDNTILFKNNNPALGILVFQPRIINIPSQRYIFDVQMTASNGTITTISDPSMTLTVIQDISR